MDLQDKFLNNHPLFKKIMALIKSGTVTEVTHSELTSLMSKGKLNVGAKYLITDFQTKHNLFRGSNPLVDINEGIVEPLLVTAVSTTKLSPVALSSMYPNDLIHYDATDILCEDGMVPRKGKITKRINTITNVGAETYDFRNVKFRRWAIDTASLTVWADGAYTAGDVVNDNGVVAIARVDILNGSGYTPAYDADQWTIIFNFNDESIYQSWDITDLQVGKAEAGFLNCILHIDVADYIDVYTFNEGETAIEGSASAYNVVIGPTLKDEAYNNIVFLAASGEMPQNNTFGSCGFATFGFGSKNNSFGHGMSKNIFSFTFENNVIDTAFANNIIRDGMTSNKIGPFAQWNLFGKQFYDNVIASYFTGNMFGGETVEDNVFGSGCHAFNSAGGMQENVFASAVKLVANLGVIGNVIYGGSVVTCNVDDLQSFIINPRITVDLALCSRVTAPYSKTIFIDSTEAVKIFYIDSAAVLFVKPVDE
jgi:hypothetical protein